MDDDSRSREKVVACNPAGAARRIAVEREATQRTSGVVLDPALVKVAIEACEWIASPDNLEVLGIVSEREIDRFAATAEQMKHLLRRAA